MEIKRSVPNTQTVDTLISGETFLDSLGRLYMVVNDRGNYMYIDLEWGFIADFNGAELVTLVTAHIVIED